MLNVHILIRMNVIEVILLSQLKRSQILGQIVNFSPFIFAICWELQTKQICTDNL